MDKKGKVYIAGAGCGDEQLITLKLKNIIRKADCIIYDRLINRNILNYARENAELIYMGKGSSEGGELQKEINDILVEKGKENLTVLRLKGGDPFVFGRGGEEIESLLKEGIEFEVIPGITSAIAVPAYAGIPVTHRGINTSFHVFTGHTKIDGEELNFPIIAKLEGTLIFLMGLSNLEKIIENLIKYGKDKGTPVAVIKEGTTSGQEVCTGTMETIVETVRSGNIKSPVVIVIGETVNMRDRMNWFEKKPLFGKNILVTRNRERQKDISDRINGLGGQAVSLPFINIEYTDFKMPDFSQYKAILFNSVNSVAGFMRKLEDIRQLKDIKIGAVGEKTAEELRKYKIIPDFFPEEYTGKKLAEECVNFTNENDKILFAVSDISSVKEREYTELYNRRYERLIVYRTVKVIQEKQETEKCVADSDILMFLSSSAFEAFAETFGLRKTEDSIDGNEENRITEILKDKIIASIGPVTTGTIEKYGFKVGIEAEKYTEEGLLEKIIEYVI